MPVLRQKLKIACLWLTRWKRSSFDYWHHPVCRGYKSGNRCICRFVAYVDMLMVRSNLSARSRGTQGAVEGKKCPRLCIKKSDPVNSILSKARKWDWPLRRDTPWNSWDSSGTKPNSGKKRGNPKELSKEVNLISEILARLVLRDEHLRKPHDKQIVTAK